MDIVTLWWMSFLAGVYAPLGSPCVIPLYPGFLSFLAGRKVGAGRKRPIIILGLAVALGVIISMLIVGTLFVAVVQVSLSRFISLISPAAFLVLAFFSIMLILDIDLGRLFPGLSLPEGKDPLRDAFLLGLFFGILILPCNAASVVVLLALATTSTGIMENLGSFLLFGAGMSLPLLLFAAVSLPRSREIVSFLTRHRRLIHATAGLIMLGVSLYYLILVVPPFSWP